MSRLGLSNQTISAHKVLVVCILTILYSVSLVTYIKTSHLASGVRYSYFNSTPIVEVLCFSFFFLCFKRISKEMIVPFLFLTSYILYFFFSATLMDLDFRLRDLLLTNKFIVYFSLICFVVNKKIFEQDFVAILFRATAVVFLIKYAISITFFGIQRPGVFTENNFELMFLSFLFITGVNQKGHHSISDYFLFFAIVSLSGSRSGMLTALALVSAINFGFGRNEKYVKLICFLLAVIGMCITLYVRSFSFDLNTIDRFKFLLVFLNEMKPATLLTWCFGNDAMTALTIQGASSLASYNTLFADLENLKVYSVIFHSAILRIVFDHGLLGLALTSTFIYRATLISTRNSRLGVLCLLIFITNGLSVSSVYSSYFMLGWMILLTTKLNADQKNSR